MKPIELSKEIYRMSLAELMDKLATEKPEGCQMRCDGCVLDPIDDSPVLHILCDLMASLHDDAHFDKDKKKS